MKWIRHPYRELGTTVFLSTETSRKGFTVIASKPGWLLVKG